MTIGFRRVSNDALFNVVTDANGHYSFTGNGDIYYIGHVSGTAPAPLGAININAGLGGNLMPQYDIRTTDLVRDFTLPDTTLNVTVKDGFGNVVPNAEVSVNSAVAQIDSYFSLTNDSGRQYRDGIRTGTTDAAGVVSLTVFKALYPAGRICT